ncbi:MAG: hypothetical protein UX61_C0004G0037, partial [Parcubacteria group bacterium GW2011_GWA2_46_7]
MKKKVVGIVLIILGIAAATIAIYLRPYKVLSPIGNPKPVIKFNKNKEVIGFYPYWNLAGL